MFKTPKGTELQLITLQGKQYLPAQQRVLWFREEHPDWTIESKLVKFDEKMCLAEAVIRDELGKHVANDFKLETTANFQDHIEKSLTGAIARALALCGYGTQFAQEMNEGTDVADSPQAPKTALDLVQAMDKRGERPQPLPDMVKEEVPWPKQEFAPTATPLKNYAPQGTMNIPSSPMDGATGGSFVIEFGKFKGSRLDKIEPMALSNYRNYLVESARKDQKPLSKGAAKAVEAIDRYLTSMMADRKSDVNHAFPPEPSFDNEEPLPF